jgi:hypothetical protein
MSHSVPSLCFLLGIVRSNREIHLHEKVVEVLKKNPTPLNVKPDDYFFTTPEGTPMRRQTFTNANGCLF